MKLRVLVLSAVVFAAPAMAAAQQSASSATLPPSSASAAKQTDPVVCRTDNELGSRIAKRKICMKVSEWREVSRAGSDWTEHKSTYLGKPGGD